MSDSLDGIGFDDYDFTHRVNNLGLNMKCIDNPYVIHQWHQTNRIYEYIEH